MAKASKVLTSSSGRRYVDIDDVIRRRLTKRFTAGALRKWLDKNAVPDSAEVHIEAQCTYQGEYITTIVGPINRVKKAECYKPDDMLILFCDNGTDTRA